MVTYKPIICLILVRKEAFSSFHPCFNENSLNSHSNEERCTWLLAYFNHNAPSLILSLINHLVFTPLAPDLDLTREFIHSTKDPTPHGGVSEVDSEVSLSSVESVDFSMEVDVHEDSFSKAFDLLFWDCDKKNPPPLDLEV